MRTKKRLPKSKKRVNGKILSQTIYLYVEPANKRFAVQMGKEPKYGTISAFINALISKARGVPPKLGTKNQGVARFKVGKKRSYGSRKTLGSLRVKEVNTQEGTITTESLPPPPGEAVGQIHEQFPIQPGSSEEVA